MAGHTPGPWLAGDKGKIVTARIGTGPSYPIVAECNKVHAMYGDFPDVTKEQRDANARLIAAAPDLLDACLKAMTCGQLSEPLQKIMDRAIRKAAGGVE